MHEEKCLEKHTVYQGPSFSIRQDRVELEDGRESRREVICRPDRVLALVYDGEKRVLADEKGHLPRRPLSPGESPEDAAGRLFAALGGEEPRFLGEVMPSPAVLGEKVLVFAGKGSGQAPEGLHWMTVSQGMAGNDLCTGAALALWALGEE
ncbi:hypothetical protein DW094_10570 [Ruminococcaceae bacterium AM07-15]|nr:hypothetical protein DW094_10570 [Ruminococcaceae bacterium AM07-15]